MPNTLDISQDLFAELIQENIGDADIADDKVADKATLTYPGKCFTTTTVRTFGSC